MSASCVGTCSHCGVRRFWLSDTLSIQLDDGRLACLPHPAESHRCEQYGLTLAQANQRRRLYLETFYVCRNCGRDGETITRPMNLSPETAKLRSTFCRGWGLAVIVVPSLVWMRWWGGAFVIGVTLLWLPVFTWRENRKLAVGLAARGLPRADAPGRRWVEPPTAGSLHETVIGRIQPVTARASGDCCERPAWIGASRMSDRHRVPCVACGQGVMTVSELSIH